MNTNMTCASYIENELEACMRDNGSAQQIAIIEAVMVKYDMEFMVAVYFMQLAVKLNRSIESMVK